jgi:hypothetical protein
MLHGWPLQKTTHAANGNYVPGENGKYGTGREGFIRDQPLPGFVLGQPGSFYIGLPLPCDRVGTTLASMVSDVVSSGRE